MDSTPVTLNRLNVETALVSDDYDHQDALGQDLIGGATNHGIDPSQAREEHYEEVAQIQPTNHYPRQVQGFL